MIPLHGFVLALAMTFNVNVARAATNAASAKPDPVSNRYLIVVETSRAMIKRGNGVLDTVNTLIMSGMKGQMHSGDTLGIWTFNDKLHIGEFPLQVWTPENRKKVAENASYFINRAKFEKKSRLDQVIPSVKDLVRESDYLTVLFLTDGSGKFSGTPFDKEINDVFAAWKAEEEKRQMPFLTILRATKGAFTHHAVVPLPWTWEMPPLPPDLVAAWNTTKKQIETLTNKPTAAVGQPLIVKGKKPDAPAVNQIATNNPPLAISNAAPAHAAATIPQTTAATNQPSARAPQAATTTTKPPTLTENPSSAAPKPPETGVPATTRPEPATAAKTSTEGNRLLMSAPTTGIEPPTASDLQLAQATTKPAPPPNSVNAPESPSSKPTAKAIRNVAASVTPQQGALVPPPTIWENEWFWVGIGIVTLVTVVVTFSVIRRSRPHSRISLITSSYDRTNKP